MLLARLVTGRYGYDTGEERPSAGIGSSSRHGWLARLMSAIFPRKRSD